LLWARLQQGGVLVKPLFSFFSHIYLNGTDGAIKDEGKPSVATLHIRCAHLLGKKERNQNTQGPF
jgi:hypothetical protein